MSNHEQVRQLIKDYYKDKELHSGLMANLYRSELQINNKSIKILDLLKYCTPYLNEDCKSTERLYHVLNDLYETPKCPVCNINTLKFKDISKGYYKTCSKKCSKNTIEYKEKYRQTCLEKYGVDNPLKSKEIRDKITATNLERYGVENPFQSEEIKEKIKETNNDKYSVDNPMQNKEIKIKQEMTLIKNFGVSIPMQNYNIKEKQHNTMSERYGSSYALQNNDLLNKHRQTNLERYGVEHVTKNKDIKEQIRQTNLEKYGVECVLQNGTIKQKSRQTCLNKYGVLYAAQNKDVFNKVIQTNLERYGVEFPLQHEDIKEKIRNTKKQYLFKTLLSNILRLNKCTPLFDLDEFKINNIQSGFKFKWRCNTCNMEFFDGLENGRSPICHSCYNTYGSTLQKTIFEFIYEYTKNVYSNDKTFGFEIDILLKDYNIGIEVNGNYWHSELNGKDKFYHANKTFESGKNGIHLIHIFEDEWLFKQNIIKSIILNKLGLLDYKYDARKLTIYEIKNDYAKDFMNNNHIQGFINGTHYGLCTQDEIISMITIGKSRFNNNYDLELLRFCHKLNSTTRGGLSRLVKHALKITNSTNIISYCDLRYGNGLGYKSSGFNFVKYSPPNYFYMKTNNYNNRMSRHKFQKHKLENILETYDQHLSEWQNMINNDYDRIWDCGNLVFEYNI